VFVIAQRYTDDQGDIVAIGTYEGNTVPQDQPRGIQGYYRRKRVIPVANLQWFCDLSGRPEGGYWT
jgi:hypothetical protein